MGEKKKGREEKELCISIESLLVISRKNGGNSKYPHIGHWLNSMAYLCNKKLFSYKLKSKYWCSNSKELLRLLWVCKNK